jgi:hypothetical protein
MLVSHLCLVSDLLHVFLFIWGQIVNQDGLASHGKDIKSRDKVICTKIYKVLAPVTSPNPPLAKASHITTTKINEVGKCPSPL